MRFDTRYGRSTRIVYVTDGILQRWLREDSELSGIGAVIFDEFHERRLASDLAIARVLDLQDGGRPELRVLVMSATLETEGLGDYLAPCEELEAGGRLYPVEVSYQPPPAPRRGRHGARESVPIWEPAARACRDEVARLLGLERGPELPYPFLPGAFEIRKTVELLSGVAGPGMGSEAPVFRAAMPTRRWVPAEAADYRGNQRCETSITIDGIVAVIDSGGTDCCFDARRGIDTRRSENLASGRPPTCRARGPDGPRPVREVME